MTIFDALLGPLLLLGVRALALRIFVVVSVSLILWSKMGRALVLQHKIFVSIIEFGIGLPIVDVTTSVCRWSSFTVPLLPGIWLFGIL